MAEQMGLLVFLGCVPDGTVRAVAGGCYGHVAHRKMGRSQPDEPVDMQ